MWSYRMQFPPPGMLPHLPTPIFCLAFSFSSFTLSSQLKYNFLRETFHDSFECLLSFSFTTLHATYLFRALVQMYILPLVSLTSAALWNPWKQGALFSMCASTTVSLEPAPHPAQKMPQLNVTESIHTCRCCV